MKYKVGDYVKVIKRFDEDAYYYYDFPCVVDAMLPMQGKIYKVNRAEHHDYEDVDIYDLEPYFAFTEEMIECRVIPVGNESFIPYNENMEVD